MNNNLHLEVALDQISVIQRQAVDWNNGALLVLAGPGSGKTQVLTCRIARLLDSGRDEHFRVLALTFTNKAADEMKERVITFVPGLEDRVNIGTFHSFCSQVLRQHGVHIGIKPDFSIYSQINDRRAVFEEALNRAASQGDELSESDTRYLELIDCLKIQFIKPEHAEEKLTNYPNRHSISLAYNVYEEELMRRNVMDF